MSCDYKLEFALVGNLVFSAALLLETPVKFVEIVIECE